MKIKQYKKGYYYEKTKDENGSNIFINTYDN